MQPDQAGTVGLAEPWVSASASNAQALLASFLPRAGRAYAKSRNYDFGPQTRGNVSQLSPYVRHRLLTEESIVRQTLERHALSTAEKFIQEVCWRTYWKGWLEHRPQLWPDYLHAVDKQHVSLRNDVGLSAAYAEAIEGRTGIVCFDDWIRELIETGYLHNHTRMWFASIWIFTLKLPWMLGADLFYRHLLDGDPASNTLSWRWVAGLQTKGKTYLARSDNIATFTDGRYPNTPQLVGFADPLEDDLPSCDITPLTMRPRPDLKAKALLLLHEDDLHPESIDLDRTNITALAALPAITEHLRLSPGVRAFKAAALSDAINRASQHFECLALQPGSPCELADHQLSEAVEAIANHAKSRKADIIITADAPVGPAKDTLDMAEPIFRQLGIPMFRIRRPWDAAFWPHAKAGFFKLKKTIPKVLEHLEVLR